MMLSTAERTKPIVLPRRETSKPLRVCFVCTGNTCRSPMAAAVANSIAGELRAMLPETVRESVSPSVEAISAGLAAIEGEPIAQNAVAALEEAGIAPVPNHDYHTHTAHRLPPEVAEQCDMIVGLSGNHVMGLLMQFPGLAGRIVGMPREIPDPYGGDLDTYRKCLSEIISGVKALLFPTHE
ncbi:MAG: hypothetical protein II955_04265 [Clostridia bacterium]|nr:hypothetical protein [Clostridia bacterium]